MNCAQGIIVQGKFPLRTRPCGRAAADAIHPADGYAYTDGSDIADYLPHAFVQPSEAPNSEPTPERICPDCGTERADYEGIGKYLPTCPHCGSRCAPGTAQHPNPAAVAPSPLPTPDVSVVLSRNEYRRTIQHEHCHDECPVLREACDDVDRLAKIIAEKDSEIERLRVRCCFEVIDDRGCGHSDDAPDVGTRQTVADVRAALTLAESVLYGFHNPQIEWTANVAEMIAVTFGAAEERIAKLEAGIARMMWHAHSLAHGTLCLGCHAKRPEHKPNCWLAALLTNAEPNRPTVESIDVKGIAELREQFAALCHEQWSDWMRWLFKASVLMGDGTVEIPRPLVERWLRQVDTDYANLPDDEQVSDRNEADRFIRILTARTTKESV